MEKKLEIDDLVMEAINVNYALKGFKAFFDDKLSVAGALTLEDLNAANALLLAVIELSSRHAVDAEVLAITMEQGGSK
ncbi:hypothetical protein EGX24_15150 [Enterococcus gallinarum]|uniref:Uncharacterized protein n=1 Tax=Enterococcus gallinarum TaxID=1353 RepID=A0AAE7MRU5_ENTGA|nr:hypothetical protein [Enterococcus gallinarum]MBM6741832.1 hypothetical protein [Enterococcus gallinarum]QOG28479.1 hypothetical protein EGM181_15045 [Enterococcus gallinarum]RBT42435.1 hypothetical protein EB54_00753 [Enterococcus gallinarum]ROY69737.1 hypothetical protein EGW90_15140 [Enterococcus gallinarum]ROZ31985.1 hypothetical protein EGX24_15150 [Enterococcus gallinarum]